MEHDWTSITAGTRVYSRDGEHVGETEEVGSNYLLTRKGWLFVTERYIPFSAVERVDADGVTLSVAKDQLDAMAWDAPPAVDADVTTRGALDATAVTRTTDTLETHAEVDAAADIVIPVVEEELRVGKREVEAGGVRVSTHVEEVPVNEQVTLRDETVQVERRPVNRTVTEADLAAMHDETIEVRETDEEAVVDKQARVVEEVVVRKDAQERTETVQDTVRRTQVDVDDVTGETRTSGVIASEATTTGATVDVDTSSATTDEGAIERGASKLGNTVERATGADIDRDGDVGRRDPRNNV